MCYLLIVMCYLRFLYNAIQFLITFTKIRRKLTFYSKTVTCKKNKFFAILLK